MNFIFYFRSLDKIIHLRMIEKLPFLIMVLATLCKKIMLYFTMGALNAKIFLDCS